MAVDPALESVGMIPFEDVYHGRRVLVTGHTGFKGSWLCAWLHHLGADTVGVALAPDTEPSHWNILHLGSVEDLRADLRDSSVVKKIIATSRPEIVFHLAAQSLVRRSYRDPIGTWSTNVMGTVNLLEACRFADCVKSIVVVTSDKCYENTEPTVGGYGEGDKLGGYDPYSASKAAAEFVVSSFRRSYFSTAGPLVATARAGNVIGGGDWAEDRLIPDLVRAAASGQAAQVRLPDSVRPWQHVLESLSGYLSLAMRLFIGQRAYARAWNFGPRAEDHATVRDVVGRLAASWPEIRWRHPLESQPHESGLLRLDSAAAHHLLAWKPVWQLDEALSATASWYQTWLSRGEALTFLQLDSYMSAASKSGVAWAV